MTTMNPSLTKIKKLVEKNIDRGIDPANAVYQVLATMTPAEHRKACEGLYKDDLDNDWEAIQTKWSDQDYRWALQGAFGDYANEYREYRHGKQGIPW